MAISVFELFKIGIGPSSSHTVGPMRAARTFTERLEERGLLADTRRIEVELFGSLAHTGRGHGTDRAIVLGLMGETPEAVDPDQIEDRLSEVSRSGKLRLAGRLDLEFNAKKDLAFRKRERLPHHSNGMRFTARDGKCATLFTRSFYSVGGGFVVSEDEARANRIVKDTTAVPYPFTNAEELMAHCRRHSMRITDIMQANEAVWRSDADIRQGLLSLWHAMQACIERGCRQSGTLPGSLAVPRRAPGLYRQLSAQGQASNADPLNMLDWVNLYALSVNEENAAGGRVVTAPTNGAAGIIPAVLSYYLNFTPAADEDGIIEFLMTAGAIGILFMLNASISGAEVGCQGEVGVACSMAAGGLAAAMGGSLSQVENAAEIGMEHNLGLTCDPVGGLVQIPCIERNAMGAIKAINAQRLAFRGDGAGMVSLDKVIKTMRDTGADMKRQYKETSRGGLAVNVVEC